MWPFWLGGAALAAAPLAYLVLVRRALGVSGRYSDLVDAVTRRLRKDEMDPELARALFDATVEEFGLEKVRQAQASAPRSQTWLDHALFLVALLLGGALSVSVSGSKPLVFASELPSTPWLVLGGVLVGAGTRMASGCTSGHGLVGLSRFEKGSVVATACFFASGVATALILEWWA